MSKCQLYSKGKKLYPITKGENIIMDDGSSLSSQLDTKAKQSDLEVERKRIDSFISLEHGSTTGDAELIDGRIGADGEIYNNIGESIRSQFDNVNNTKVDEDIVFNKVSTGEFINILMNNVGGTQKFEDGTYGHYEINCQGGETYKYTGVPPSSTFPAFVLLDSSNKVLRAYPVPNHANKITDYIFRTPSTCTKIYINKHKDSVLELYKATYTGFKERVNEIEATVRKLNSDMQFKADKITEFREVAISINPGLVSVKDLKPFPSMGCHAFCEVTEGQKIQVTGFSWSSNDAYPAYAFFDANNNLLSIFGEPDTRYTNIEVTVPKNAVKILISGQRSCGLKTLYEYPLQEFVIDNIQHRLADTEYEVENIKRRMLTLENSNSFEWKTFDKSYFLFIIDDSNEFLAPMYELFHSYGVPLSTACIIDNLSKTYSTSNGLTVKQVNDLIVADGGEVLAHYSGNLADKGYTDDSGRTYLTEESDWLARTRDVKRILENNGYKVRGIIRADYTITNSFTGEEMCRRYFDYSDNMGKSKQYNISRRFFGQSSVADLTAYIDRCCKTPGIYPFCLHGTEPASSIANMQILLDYVKSKGSVAEITTYANVFDKFGSDKLNKLFEILNNNK